MCYVFHAWAFDDVMTFGYQDFSTPLLCGRYKSMVPKLKFDYLKNEKSFRSEIKIFFFVLQVLSFRLTKQTSKNLADTTFSLPYEEVGRHEASLKINTILSKIGVCM